MVSHAHRQFEKMTDRCLLVRDKERISALINIQPVSGCKSAISGFGCESQSQGTRTYS